MKTLLSLIIIALISLILPGCALITDEDTVQYDEVILDTDFERMTGYMPYDVIESYDIWYDNWIKAKQLRGIADVTSIEELLKSITPEEIVNRPNEQRVFRLEISEILPQRLWLPQVASQVGLDIMIIDRVIYTKIPPHSFSIVEGNFDEDLITGKLSDLGYVKTDYGDDSYYGIRGDYEIDLRDPFGREVLNAMNRVAVLDNTLIIAPATDNVTTVLDTRSGKTKSALDNSSIQALADSLGEVLTAVITTPERVLSSFQLDEEPVFYFNIPEDWNLLHQYEMVGMGLRAEGEERYFEIALFYEDRNNTEVDGAELSKRMNSYLLGTFSPEFEPIPLADCFDVGEPVVTNYEYGAVLKISCRLIPGSRFESSVFIKGFELRDVLFLAPEPHIYTK